MVENDICIVGAGSAGLTLALLLADLPLKIAVLDKEPAPELVSTQLKAGERAESGVKTLVESAWRLAGFNISCAL